MKSNLRFLYALVLVAVSVNGILAAAQATHAVANAKPGAAAGKQTFASTCSGCHGLDARGGERAPNIVDNAAVRRLSDEQLAGIIHNGIPGSGMPAFHTLAAPQVKSIVAYLRGLQGANQTTHLPGDTARGKTLFFGKAKCSSCHMVAGEGGFIAADLSEYARTRDLEQMRSAIVDLAASRSGQVRLITATTQQGDRLVGRVRNEDNFSLQMQTLDGTFLFLSKSEIQSLESSAEPLMPSDYRSTLSPQELNDVLSFLMNVAGVSTSTPAAKKREEWD